MRANACTMLSAPAWAQHCTSTSLVCHDCGCNRSVPCQPNTTLVLATERPVRHHSLGSLGYPRQPYRLPDSCPMTPTPSSLPFFFQYEHMGLTDSHQLAVVVQLLAWQVLLDGRLRPDRS